MTYIVHIQLNILPEVTLTAKRCNAAMGDVTDNEDPLESVTSAGALSDLHGGDQAGACVGKSRYLSRVSST